MADKAITINDMATFCKKKGFVFPNSEMYGGFSGFFDYGPLGVEVKNNIKQSWWKRFVKSREDVFGIDGSIISHPKVWKASGHVDCFSDKMIYCNKHKKSFRADQLIEDVVGKPADGLSKKQLLAEISIHSEKFKKAGYDLAQDISDFNLMFRTFVGSSQSEDAVAYLRPETAQLIFADFKAVCDTSRAKLPFGIAQIGKAFRNEISPRDFLFRTREFEQMEIEYFIHPEMKECSLLTNRDFSFNILTAKHQKQGKEHGQMSAAQMLSFGLADEWHVYWLLEQYKWFLDMGIAPLSLRLREHLKDELAHYSSACFDIEYKFPFGWKEIHGSANRGQFDLTQHKRYSKENLELFDEESKQKVIPRVIEPSQGVDRAFLAFLFDAYHDDSERGNVVLRLHPALAPIKVGVFPLVNKLREKSREIFDPLKEEFECFFDASGSIGRRYARADEQGIAYCVTVDFETLDDASVTVRDRDTTAQVRVKIGDIADTLSKLLSGKVAFSDAGKAV